MSSTFPEGCQRQLRGCLVGSSWKVFLNDVDVAAVTEPARRPYLNWVQRVSLEFISFLLSSTAGTRCAGPCDSQ
jgi:hypothetical protein